MPPLRIAQIHDHLAGHTRQCEAIVAAIADIRSVEVTRLSVGPWSPLRSHLTRRPLMALPGVGVLLPVVVRGDWRRPFDLIVSASGATISGSVLLKRRNSARNIFSGLARGISDGDIDCILVHRPEHVTSPRHIFGPAPVLRFRRPGERRPFTRLSGASIGVVLGGEARGAGFNFGDDYSDILFRRLAAVDAVTPDIVWKVVTSRRTPASNYPAIEAFAAGVARCEIVDARSAGLGSIERVYDADAVLVTEDSKTMVTEFLRNCYPVGILKVPRLGATDVHAYFADLEASGDVPFLDPGALDAQSIESALARIRISQVDVYEETRAAIGRLLPDVVAA
jgi:mitochondrial fission protein ELM1